MSCLRFLAGVAGIVLAVVISVRFLLSFFLFFISWRWFFVACVRNNGVPYRLRIRGDASEGGIVLIATLSKRSNSQVRFAACRSLSDLMLPSSWLNTLPTHRTYHTYQTDPCVCTVLVLFCFVLGGGKIDFLIQKYVIRTTYSRILFGWVGGVHLLRHGSCARVCARASARVGSRVSTVSRP